MFDESATFKLADNTVPGASFTTDDETTLTASFDYYLSDAVSLSVVVGIPPTAELTGTGPLAGLELGEVTYGPATFTALYHFQTGFPSVDLYAGGGINYTLILDTEDGAVSDFEVDDGWGFVAQVGLAGQFENRTSGWFADIKYIDLDIDATGYVGPAPASAAITLNPLILSLGLEYQF